MRKPKTDKEYWKQYATEENGTGQNHEINLDVKINFRGLNGGVIYQTNEKEINCNVDDLETFFNNLKKVIKMLDETIVDKETKDGGLF